MPDSRSLNFSHSIIFKSLAILLVSMSFIIIGATYIFTERQSKLVIEWSNNNNKSQLQQIMAIAQNELVQFGNRLETLSKSSEVISMDPLRASGYLKSYNISTMFYSGENVSLFDNKGQLICDNSMLKAPMVKFHLTGQTLQDRYRTSPWFRDNESDVPQKTYGISVINSAIKAGSLYSNFSSRRLWKKFSENKVGQNGILIAINSKNQILYHTDLTKWLKGIHYLDELGFNKIDPRSYEINEIKFITLANGETYLANYAFDPASDLGIFALQPKSEIDDLLRSAKLSSLIILSASIITLLILALWLYSYMGRPMRNLIQHIWRITKGDLYVDEIKVGKRHDEIGLLAKSFNTMHNTIKRQIKELNTHRDMLEEEVKERTRELQEVNQKLDIISRTDELTGLPNRRDMNNSINKEISRYERTQKPFCFLFIDIDHFKNINDTYGHGCGDKVLKTVAQTLHDLLRRYDILARYGGEEFLTLLPETDLDSATTVAERFRQKVEETVIQYAVYEIKVTITIGVTRFDPKLGASHSIQTADKALYEGKESGRNKVVVWDPKRTTEKDYMAAAIEIAEEKKAKEESQGKA